MAVQAYFYLTLFAVAYGFTEIKWDIAHGKRYDSYFIEYIYLDLDTCILQCTAVR